MGIYPYVKSRTITKPMLVAQGDARATKIRVARYPSSHDTFEP
jgi:hypothetical protein